MENDDESMEDTLEVVLEGILELLDQHESNRNFRGYEFVLLGFTDDDLEEPLIDGEPCTFEERILDPDVDEAANLTEIHFPDFDVSFFSTGNDWTVNSHENLTLMALAVC